MAGPLGVTLLSPGEGVIQADIVFVHGFGGDAFKTWTSGNAFWPRDFLAKDLKNARIFTWGYESSVPEPLRHNFSMTISRHGKTLLNDIAHLRINNCARPLIFVCHSLGGLVLKEALIRSAESLIPEYRREENWRDLAAIYTSCKGVVFLGTPHRGFSKTSIGDLASRVAKFTLQGSYDELFHVLKRYSDTLEHQTRLFTLLADEFPIACMYEQLPTAIGIIVPEHSASIDGNNVRTISLPAEHMAMCKFADKNNVGYREVSRFLKFFIREAVNTVVQGEQEIKAGVSEGGLTKTSEAIISRSLSACDPIPLAFEDQGQASSPVSSAASSKFFDSTFSTNEESLVYSRITGPTDISARIMQRKPGLSSVIAGFSTSEPEDDICSLSTVDDDIISVDGSVTSVGERTTTAEYLVKAFSEDDELSALYRNLCTGPQKLEQTSFLRNHRRLLRLFFLDAEEMIISPQDRAAANFLKSKPRRQQISSLVYQSAAGNDFLTLNLKEKTEKLRGIDAYLASLPRNLNSQEHSSDSAEASDYILGEGIEDNEYEQLYEDDLEEQSDEENEEGQSSEGDEQGHPKLLNLESAVQFLTHGHACMAYKARLRRLARGLAPADRAFRHAMEAKEVKDAQSLLEKDSAAIFRGQSYNILRHLTDCGHSYESIVADLMKGRASNTKSDDGEILNMMMDRYSHLDEVAEQPVEDDHSSLSAGKAQEALLRQGLQYSATTETYPVEEHHSEPSNSIQSSFGEGFLILTCEVLLMFWVTGIADFSEMCSVIPASVAFFPWFSISRLLETISFLFSTTATTIRTKITCGTRPTLQPGCSRVTWTCLCGKCYSQEFGIDDGLEALKMYEVFSGAGYCTTLQASAFPVPEDGRTFQERHARPIQVLNDALPSFGSASGETGRSSGIQSLDQQLSMRQQRHRECNIGQRTSRGESRTRTNDPGETSTSSDSEEEQDIPRKWLLFCFDHREIVSKMKHIRLSEDSSDLELFPLLRSKYYSYKITWSMRRLGLTRFVAYFIDYEIKTASFVKFRLLPDLRSPNGMPSKLEEWKPDLYWSQGSEWEPAQIGDRPEIDTKWFLCHWAHPDEDWLRFWNSVRETLGDARTNIGKANSYASALWQTMSKKFKTQTWERILSLWHRDHEARDDSEGPDRSRTSLDLNSMSFNTPGEECIVTILQSTSKRKPKPRFLVRGPKKIHRRLKPGVDKPPHGWGLYITEEKKKHGVVFVMIFLFLITNVCLLGYVIPRGLFAMETMVLSACSLITTIVLFLNK